MQNKKGEPRRSANLHVTYREASRSCGSLRRCEPTRTLSATLLASHPRPYSLFLSLSLAVRFAPFLFQPGPSSPAASVSTSADVHVFRARLRFRLLDAEERLIVAPFLSVAFTAWGNSPRRENGEGRPGGSGKRGTIDFSVVHVTTDEFLLSPVAFRGLSISVARIFLFDRTKSAGKKRRHARGTRAF